MQREATASSTLYVKQWGSSGPKIVFVHGGGPNDAANFQQQKPLMERWTLLLPDRMGYGKTPANSRRDFEKDAPLIADVLGGGSHSLDTPMVVLLRNCSARLSSHHSGG